MTLTRAIAGWLVLLAVAFANGAIRQLGYGPALGDALARQVSSATAVALLVAAIRVLTRRWRLGSARQAWGVGALWTGLTVAFELGFGRARGLSWGVLLADWEIWRGRTWPLVLVAILVTPAALRALDARRRAAPP
jgi:hypothetical protein